jgi:hypothetical protein
LLEALEIKETRVMKVKKEVLVRLVEKDQEDEKEIKVMREIMG